MPCHTSTINIYIYRIYDIEIYIYRIYDMQLSQLNPGYCGRDTIIKL